MAYVVNGIGTWQYGRDRAHVLKGTCEHCGAYGNLASYDTTLYFVVFFVPLIPLSRRRIQSECPFCRRHRYLKLADWEKAKAKVFADLTEAMRSGGDADAAIVRALGAAAGFQDEPLFEQVAAAAAGRDGAAVQTTLAEGYAYFARWPKAEEAYRKVVAAADSPQARDQLALAQLKQGRPDDALPHVQKSLADKDGSRAWLSYLTAEAYQAQGRHREALAIMDARDEAFPQLVQEPSYVAQRRLSVKHQDSGKPIKGAVLGESTRAGYSEGGGTRRWLHRAWGPAIAFGLLALYLGSAWYIGDHRKLYLVNGGMTPYSVVVNGQSYTLAPEREQAITVSEGDVALAAGDVDWSLPATVPISTNFWSRPFVRHTFVLNPDRLALVVWEETEYAEQRGNNTRPHQTHIGELLMEFHGVEYEFKQFPATIEGEKGSRFLKERIYLEPLGSTEKRAGVVMHLVPNDQHAEYVLRIIRSNPEDSVALRWLNVLLEPAAVLKALTPRLAERPVLTAIHRACQVAKEEEQPDFDQRPEYRKLVEETNRSPDALYLLGRLEDEPQAEAIYREAIAGAPSAYAYYGWGYRLLARGDAAGAVEWLTKARALRPTDGLLRVIHMEALTAAGQFAALEQICQADPELASLRDRLLCRLAQGDPAGADQIVKEYLATTAPEADQRAEVERNIQATRACLTRDRAAYLRAMEADAKTFEVLFLTGKAIEAADLVVKAPSGKAAERGAEIQQRGLLYLALSKSGPPERAEEQWTKLLAAVASDSGRDKQLKDLLSGKVPFDLGLFRNLPIETQQKRVLSAVLAQRHPEHAAALYELAIQLDFDRDSMSLCLRQVIPAPARP